MTSLFNATQKFQRELKKYWLRFSYDKKSQLEITIIIFGKRDQLRFIERLQPIESNEFIPFRTTLFCKDHCQIEV